MPTPRLPRRTAAALVSLAVTALTASMITITPAQAFLVPQPLPINWLSVKATSVSDGLTKSATVTCPAGYQVAGPGGLIIDTGYAVPWAGGSGRVSITAMVPDAGLTSVTVTGAIRDPLNWDPLVDTFQVRAQAICVKVGYLTGLSLVSSPSVDNGTASAHKTSTAACPAGQTVYGGGYDIAGADGKVFATSVTPSADLAEITGAATDELLNRTGQTMFSGQVAPVPYVGVWDLTTFAVCAGSRAGDSLTSAPAATFGATYAKVTAPICPPGSVVTGAGFDVTIVPLDVTVVTFVAVVQLTATPSGLATLPSTANRATTGASIDLTDAWQLTGYTICH